MACGGTPVRRTPRQVKPSLRARESEYIGTLKKAGIVRSVGSDDDDEYLNMLIDKPNIIHDSEFITGEDIFKFQTRKQRDSLIQKVAETCGQKTPYTIRKKTKSRIARIIEDSDSEYELSSDKSSSSSGDDADKISSSTEAEDESQHETKQPIKMHFTNTTLPPTRTRTKTKYTINTEEYFEHSTSKKIQTSNNTLDNLDTPRLPRYQLQKILEDMKSSREHEKSVRELSEASKSCFKKWYYLLNENFNILLYGLGSKRNTIRRFQEEYLNNDPVIVVNGFFPTVTAKNILDLIIVDLLEMENPGNLNEACDLIVQEFKSMSSSNSHLYILIHNIEGITIRNSKSQNVLATLAAVKNIHLIASIDHINAPLIWDHSKLSKFNFIWSDVTSYLPYLEETSYESSMMVQQSGALALSSLRNVFLSLTANSKSIYLLIVRYQLENGKNQYYQGLAFRDLYMSCRESFIVSSDLALRAQLTEFVDHKMVKMKRSVDGTEYLMIPLGNSLLQKFVDEQIFS